MSFKTLTRFLKLLSAALSPQAAHHPKQIHTDVTTQV